VQDANERTVRGATPGSREPDAASPSRPAVAVSDPPWLRRLWSMQRVPLPPEKLHWWSIHVQRFLKFVRKHPEQGPVEILVAHFLADLDVQTPPIGAWQRDQIRQALSVFVRGIQNWHLEADEQGLLRPAFRLKTTVPEPATESAGTQTAPGGSRPSWGGNGPSAGDPLEGGVPEVTSGERGSEPWLERFQACMRLQRYSLRTEEAYRDWIRRYLRFHGAATPGALRNRRYGNSSSTWQWRGTCRPAPRTRR
jgi:hypothetical protein